MDILEYFKLPKLKRYTFQLNDYRYIVFAKQYNSKEYNIFITNSHELFRTILKIDYNEYDFYIDEEWVNMDEFKGERIVKSFKIEQKMIYK